MKNILSWMPTILIILFFSIIALMGYSEWWNIAIGNEADQYAWGETNENSWFYHTPKLYSYVKLVEGLLMSSFILLGIKEMRKRKIKFSKWFFGCFILIILMFVSSNLRWDLITSL